MPAPGFPSSTGLRGAPLGEVQTETAVTRHVGLPFHALVVTLRMTGLPFLVDLSQSQSNDDSEHRDDNQLIHSAEICGETGKLGVGDAADSLTELPLNEATLARLQGESGAASINHVKVNYGDWLRSDDSEVSSVMLHPKKGTPSSALRHP